VVDDVLGPAPRRAIGRRRTGRAGRQARYPPL